MPRSSPGCRESHVLKLVAGAGERVALETLEAELIVDEIYRTSSIA
jgi:hypothetical protein